MKKAIALVLVLVLCLALVACDNSEEMEKYKKYETLINYLEEEEYQKAYTELLKLSMGGKSPTEATEKAKTTVQITMDNWQDYFEILPYKYLQYNDFGDVTWQSIGHALYLKDEYKDRLVNGIADISFKVGATIEYREFDSENRVFIEGGKVYSTRDTEFVTEVSDCRQIEDTDNDISTGHGQVYAEMVCGGGVIDGNIHYEGCYTNFEIHNVTGSMELYDE